MRTLSMIDFVIRIVAALGLLLGMLLLAFVCAMGTDPGTFAALAVSVNHACRPRHLHSDAS
jgi:hypothetical protein